MKVRAKIQIYGKVQGVFFRSSIRRIADDYNVKGWVQNLSNGNVLTVLEGEAENVKKVIDFCEKGPSRAKVTDIQVTWEDFKNAFQEFTVRI